MHFSNIAILAVSTIASIASALPKAPGSAPVVNILQGPDVCAPVRQTEDITAIYDRNGECASSFEAPNGVAGVKLSTFSEAGCVGTPKKEFMLASTECTLGTTNAASLSLKGYVNKDGKAVVQTFGNDKCKVGADTTMQATMSLDQCYKSAEGSFKVVKAE